MACQSSLRHGVHPRQVGSLRHVSIKSKLIASRLPRHEGDLGSVPECYTCECWQGKQALAWLLHVEKEI